MLSGSAVLRVGILIVVAAVLAGIIQILRPHDGGTPEAPISRTAPETGAAGTQAAVPPAVTRPVSPVSPAPLPQAAPSPAPAPAPNAPLPAPTPNGASPTSPLPSAPALPSPGLDLGTTARPTSPSAGEEAIDNAAETAGPRGVAIVDLNTGTVAELNGLRGGGMIGRAIVQKRPYTSIGELLSKRVLSRAVYERIKDQVTVR